MRIAPVCLAVLALAACKEAAVPPPVYLAVPVARRDLIVSARASGAIQPDTTVEVKSQASGEILQISVETGQVVSRGALMVRIDPRIPTNNVAQAQANLDVAQARLANAESQKGRADELFKSQSITQADNEAALLDYATAKAGVVTAQVTLQNGQITLDQSDVRAPIAGTIIELDVERGQVISSPTSTVGGGTVLLKMADLNRVQVNTLVDETDIGKIAPGLSATVTVDAYPNRPFAGTVLKIEPQATVQQNVTMFPVLVRIENREGLLKPGMNTEVEVYVGRRVGVLTVPNAALRTQKDVASAAQVLGLSPQEVQAELAEAPAGADSGRARTTGAMLQKVGSANGGGGRGDRSREGGPEGAGAGADTRFGGRYIVFVTRGGQPMPVNIRTGLTDLDYSEVVSGLQEGDSVLILPSQSLVQAQKDFKERIGRVTGGGLPGLKQQQPAASGSGSAATTRPSGGRP